MTNQAGNGSRRLVAGERIAFIGDLLTKPGRLAVIETVEEALSYAKNRNPQNGWYITFEIGTDAELEVRDALAQFAGREQAVRDVLEFLTIDPAPHRFKPPR